MSGWHRGRPCTAPRIATSSTSKHLMFPSAPRATRHRVHGCSSPVLTLDERKIERGKGTRGTLHQTSPHWGGSGRAQPAQQP